MPSGYKGAPAFTVGNDAARVERMLEESSPAARVRGPAGPVGSCPGADGVRAGAKGQRGAAAPVAVHGVPGDACTAARALLLRRMDEVPVIGAALAAAARGGGPAGSRPGGVPVDTVRG